MNLLSDGVSDLDRLHLRRPCGRVRFLGFDLRELEGADLQRDLLEWRKAAQAQLLRRSNDVIHCRPCRHVASDISRWSGPP